MRSSVTVATMPLYTAGGMCARVDGVRATGASNLRSRGAGMSIAVVPDLRLPALAWAFSERRWIMFSTSFAAAFDPRSAVGLSAWYWRFEL